jgi:hypothetical protein
MPYGGFHKWGIPKKQLVYNGKSMISMANLGNIMESTGHRNRYFYRLPLKNGVFFSRGYVTNDQMVF